MNQAFQKVAIFADIVMIRAVFLEYVYNINIEKKYKIHNIYKNIKYDIYNN